MTTRDATIPDPDEVPCIGPLTVGQLRSILDGRPDHEWVVMATDGDYVHVDGIGLPRTDLSGDWQALTLFPGEAPDWRDL